MLLSVDSHFLLTAPVCSSLTSFFTGGDSSNKNLLACWFDSTKYLLYIYGFDKDLMLSSVSSTGSVEIEIMVTGFSNPPISFPASDFT